MIESIKLFAICLESAGMGRQASFILQYWHYIEICDGYEQMRKTMQAGYVGKCLKYKTQSEIRAGRRTTLLTAVAR